MAAYDNNWVYLNKFIDNKITNLQNSGRIYLAEVISSDGYAVSVKFVSDEEDKAPFNGIPVLQSKYDTLITQPGDYGLLLDLRANIGDLLSGIKGTNIISSRFWVFIPLIAKTDYVEGTYDNLHRIISSPDRASYIKIGDDGLVVEIVTDVTIKADKLNIETTTAANVKSGEIGINGESAVKIESAAITIKGQDPIDFGTSQSLGATLGEICDALSGFMTLPTSPGAPAAADPGFVAKISAAKAKLSQILK